MRVLLDSNLPRAFATLLPGHRTQTTHERRWSDLDDGPLLDAAEGEFDAFVTMDQNLRFQQNLRHRQLRIIVLRAPRNSLPVAILDRLEEFEDIDDLKSIRHEPTGALYEVLAELKRDGAI